MSAYVIAQIEIHDPEEYQSYLKGFMPIFERFSGRLLVSSAQEPKVLEGKWDLPSVVVLEFPDTDHAQNWISDPEYQKLAHHRHRSARTNLVLVEGCT
ncbi:DUF1330 domain-containing protein [Ruegeria hyattellae]|uniref:DUF1330 domain-containing protein n=1 Tax=Ruegeria hyattellae TaxID=3233337 RepID=UPI00355BAE91